MTEAEWQTTTEPVALLTQLGAAVPRKLRLFGVACCRQIAPLMRDPGVRDALTIAERYADGWERRSALVHAGRSVGNNPTFDPWKIELPSSYAAQAVRALCQPGVMFDPAHVLGWITAAIETSPADVDEERVVQAALFRDIFGNPFRPVAFDPNWRTSTVVALAQQMYESRDFAPIPILADALQDAGCEHPDILAHCRGEGPHVRGCWVVDGVLGKA